MRYNYRCVRAANSNCWQDKTDWTIGYYNIIYLDRQAVKLEFNEFLRGFQLDFIYYPGLLDYHLWACLFPFNSGSGIPSSGSPITPPTSSNPSTPPPVNEPTCKIKNVRQVVKKPVKQVNKKLIKQSC